MSEEMNKNEELINEVHEGDENYNEENILLKEEEINSLTEDMLYEYLQKTEYAIDKMEFEIIEDDERYQLYLALKKQEKVLSKKVKSLDKEVKEKGFFDYATPWMFVYIIFVVLFGIFPINPFLPLLLIGEMIELGWILEVTETIKNILYIAYMCLLILPGFVICIFYNKKTKENKLRVKTFLIMHIIATIISLIGVVLYILWA